MVRKFTKSKSIIPTDDAIRKVVYMSVSEISKKWIMPVRDWGLTYAQFMMMCWFHPIHRFWDRAFF